MKIILCFFSAVVLLGLTAFAQSEGPRKVWIYSNVTKTPPRTDDTPLESHQESVFAPFFFFPQSAAAQSQITVSDQCTDADVGKSAAETCVVCNFEFRGPNDFLGTMFIPGGTNPGTRPGVNVTDLLRLGQNPGKKVFLKFKARSSDFLNPKAQFKVGGLRVGEHKDGLVFSKFLDVRVTDRWREYKIDLTGNNKGLESVVCPFAVVVIKQDNPDINNISIYIDDIRFEVGEPSPDSP